MNRHCFPAVLALAALLSFDTAAETRFSSGQARVGLLELYTSEGCSSCPPADRWFTALVESPALWRSVVPVAFHVDYWNYLGWPDRFASTHYSDRQRNYRRQGITNGVYTPGMVLAGSEWQEWRRGVSPMIARETAGNLSLTVDGSALEARFEGGVKGNVLHVAILGFGLKSPVQRGENRGRLLQHDFVVLAHQVYRPGQGQWRGTLPEAPLAGEAERLGVAAWIAKGNRNPPLQAAGGWLPDQALSDLTDN